MATLESSREQPLSQDPGRYVPNSEILGNDSTYGPSLPTIRDLWHSERTTTEEGVFSRVIGRLFDTVLNAVYLPNGDLINHVRMARHIDFDLADPLPFHHDVYLVTRISKRPIGEKGLMRLSRGSMSHWSVYCHGHYYHLSAPGLPRRIIEKSQEKSARESTTSRLRHEDLSSELTDDYKRLASGNHRALMAYKVGQTDYSQEQVLRLAEWIISRLPEYGLFTANCQDFAITLIARTVMRIGDRSIFAGTAVQLAKWDRSRSNAEHINRVDVGFLVGPPLPLRPTPVQAFILDLKAMFRNFSPHHPRQHCVARLYYGGRDDFPDVYYGFRELRREFIEMKEDLVQRRWKNVIFGRKKK